MYQIGNIYVITAIAVIGGALFGFDISSMSAIIPFQPYLCYFNQQGFNSNGECLGPTAMTQGGITASMPGGSWLGALFSGFLTDLVGRKKAIMFACIIWIAGSVIICAAQSIPMLIVGRILNGFCVGIASAQVPVYISELAPPTKRGRLVGAQQWAITWGILIMFYLSYGCSYIQGTAAFRVPWGLQMIPGFLLFFGLMFTPESPRWLARKRRWEECKAVLTLVHGKGDANNPLVSREMKEIRDMVEFEDNNADVSWLELFRPGMLNRTHIGIFTQVWSQLTGMNVMMYYITYIFLMAGQGSQDSLLLSSSIQYVINVVMTVPALLWLDRWGRRIPLLVGAALMATWMFANAGILASHGEYAGPDGFRGNTAASWRVRGPAASALIASTYLFVASYAPTWGPVSWVYPPELYPLRVRGKAVALATSSNWAFNFALAWFVPPAFVNIQWRTYLIFGAFLVAMFFHVFFLFPETAGKTLEEIKVMFEGEHGEHGERGGGGGGAAFFGTPAWKTKVKYQRAVAIEAGDWSNPDTVSAVASSEDGGKGDASPERKSEV